MNKSRGDALWPNHSFIVVRRLNDCSNQTAGADTVAAHEHALTLAFLVRKIELKCVRILCTEVEDISDFNTFCGNKCRSAHWARITSLVRRNFRVLAKFAMVTRDQHVFASIGERLEFVRKILCEYSTTCLNYFYLEAATIVRANVCLQCLLIKRRKIFLCGVEAVHVLHAELAATKHARFCTKFIAELCINLIRREWEIFIRLYELLDERRNDFLVCTAKSVILSSLRLELKQHVHAFPTVSGVPILLWLKRWHENLARAKIIHFLANDLLDIAKHRKAEWKPGVHASHFLIDESRLNKKTSIN